MTSDWMVYTHHVYHETNGCDHMLVIEDTEQIECIVEYSFCSTNILYGTGGIWNYYTFTQASTV